MASILGVFGGEGHHSAAVDSFNRLKSEVERDGSTVRTVFADHGHCIGIVCGEEDRSYSVCEWPDGTVSVVQGEVGASGKRGAAALPLTLALGDSPDWLHGLDGSFAAAGCGPEGTAFLCCDRHGYRPMYVRDSGGFLAFCDHAAPLALSADGVPEPDVMSIAQLLGYGQLLGSRSLFRGVSMLDPGTVVRFTRYGRSVARAEYRYAEEGESASTEELAALLTDAPAGLAAVGTPGACVTVPLSGGLDSRIIAAAVARRGDSARTFSFGDPTSPDVEIAAVVARMLGTQHRSYPLVPTAFVDSIEDVLTATDGECCLIHSHGFTTYPNEALHASVALSGFAGDLTVGGSYISGAHADPLTETVHKMRMGFDDRTVALLGGEAWSSALRDTTDELGALWDRLPEESVENRVDHFALLTRVRRFTLNGLKAMSPYLEYRMPFFQRDLFDRTLTLPVEQRRDSSLYASTYREHFGSLARIPWQRTGASLVRGAWFNLGDRGFFIPGIRQPAFLVRKYSAAFVSYDDWFRGPLRPWVGEYLSRKSPVRLGLVDGAAYERTITDVGTLGGQEVSLLLTLEGICDRFLKGWTREH